MVRLTASELRQAADLAERLDPSGLRVLTLKRDTRDELLLSPVGEGRNYPVMLEAARESRLREREQRA